jgi:hypothetical protein
VTRAPITRLLLVTEPDGSFAAGAKTWTVPDTARICALLGQAGHKVEAVRVDRLLARQFENGDLLIYTSAFSPALRQYIRDVIYFVRERVRIAPEFDLLLAHENKGVQEILKQVRGFGNLPGEYHVDFDERSASPPYVFKTSEGAGSSGVRLVRGAADEAAIKRHYFGTNLSRRLKLLQRRAVLGSAEHFRRYSYYYKSLLPFVTQPFVEGLRGDVKVLVFGDRLYTLARSNRPNDFRASGSGRFDFDAECPPAILDFARDVAERFDTPFISLDVAQGKSGCHLLEFQALNFGPLTLTGSNGYYVRAGEGWTKVSAAGDHEDAIAHAIATYVSRADRAA